MRLNLAGALLATLLTQAADRTADACSPVIYPTAEGPEEDLGVYEGLSPNAPIIERVSFTRGCAGDCCGHQLTIVYSGTDAALFSVRVGDEVGFIEVQEGASGTLESGLIIEEGDSVEITAWTRLGYRSEPVHVASEDIEIIYENYGSGCVNIDGSPDSFMICLWGVGAMILVARRRVAPSDRRPGFGLRRRRRGERIRVVAQVRP